MARISVFSSTKNLESVIFYKESKSNKKIWRLGWEGVGVWLEYVIFYSFFFHKNLSLKKKMFSFLEGVKVREDWLVCQFVLLRIQM